MLNFLIIRKPVISFFMSNSVKDTTIKFIFSYKNKRKNRRENKWKLCNLFLSVLQWHYFSPGFYSIFCFLLPVLTLSLNLKGTELYVSVQFLFLYKHRWVFSILIQKCQVLSFTPVLTETTQSTLEIYSLCNEKPVPYSLHYSSTDWNSLYRPRNLLFMQWETTSLLLTY